LFVTHGIHKASTSASVSNHRLLKISSQNIVASIEIKSILIVLPHIYFTHILISAQAVTSNTNSFHLKILSLGNQTSL
jgi:hypothetical protein